MRDLEILLKEYIDKCTLLGIKVGRIWEIVINVKFKKTYGRCSILSRENLGSPKMYRIEIAPIFLDENVDIIHLENTIIHELLHTVDGCFNHGEKWKFFAEKVNKEFGYNIKRVSSLQEMDIKVNLDDYKYAFECVECGQIVTKTRMCNFVRDYQFCTCLCGGNFKRIK